ncbi:MAG: hypothetical protein AAGI63_02815 [Planctomycetota bacterium]
MQPTSWIPSSLFSLLLVLLNAGSAQSDDSVLLFEDTFERNESQEEVDELGNEWGTNSKKRAGGNKQVDLGDGTLRIFRHKTADHAVSVVHPAAYKDCRVELKFRLDNKGDDLGIDFADMQCKEVHAGHICKIYFRPEGIEILDFKLGRMKKDFRDAVRAGTATDEQKEAVKKYQTSIPYTIKLKDWHSAIVTIVGDTLAVELDGKKIGSFASPGMDHPQKDMIRFSARKEVWLDDVRMFALNSITSSDDSAATSEVKHLFVAKLLLRRMEAVDLTPTQLAAFNELSKELRSQIDTMRAEVGIDKEAIKRRDEVYSELKKTSLSGDAFWAELQNQGGFTDGQRDVFRQTQERYTKFKTEAIALLSKEQKARLPKPKKRK